MGLVRILNLISIIVAVSSLPRNVTKNGHSIQEKLKQIEIMIDSMKKQIEMLSICLTTSPLTCGPCICRDDNRLVAKHYCDCRNLPPKRDCLDHYKAGMKVNGIFLVHRNMSQNIEAYCDMQTDGGGWTVFQRRIDGSLKFYRDWLNYKVGFGDLQHEFWLGNDELCTMSNQGNNPRGNELRIELEDWKGEKRYAKYESFRIDDETKQYKLHVGKYFGNAGDGGNGMLYHNGMKFTTLDKDNDQTGGDNCAQLYKGGWWYNDCHYVNLNGRYYDVAETFPVASGIHWHPFNGYTDSLKHVEMKLRRIE